MLGRSLIVAGLLVLFGAGLTVLASDSDVPIDWGAIPPLSLPRHSGATVVVDGLVYAIGGIEYGNSMTIYGQSYDVTMGTLVEVYDPSAGAWTRLADLPYPMDIMARRTEGRMWLAAAAHEGKIYAFGGANLNDEVHDTIYLTGGAGSTDPYSPQDYVSDCYAFDPATFTFEPLPPMPVARNMAFAGADLPDRRHGRDGIRRRYGLHR